MSKKLRILFPYVEAGTGHIMPMKAFVFEFRKKYGNEFDIIETDFFKEKNDKELMSYEEWFCNKVRKFAASPIKGRISTIIDRLLPIKLVSWYMMKFSHKNVYYKAIEQMESYHADIVFSTHWATNYYARKCHNKPYSIIYCPDCDFCHAFSYDSDLAIIGNKQGYDKALKKKYRFNKDNLKLSTFLIRNEVFSISLDKYLNRQSLGLPKDNFTICFMEGGYGIGKMEALCNILVKEERKLTIIAACGKNEELYNKFCNLKVNENITFIPLPMTEKVLNYIASCDLFIGKGGNSIAEPTFFGHASIISTLSTGIEKTIARYYEKVVGSAIICTNVKKIIKYIHMFSENPELLKKYEMNALKDHKRYGAEPCVNLVYEEIKKWEAHQNA